MLESDVARAVGSNVRRKDGDAKVTGAAKYIDDLTFPGMIYGATIRSTVPRGANQSVGESTCRRISRSPITATFPAPTMSR